MSKKLGKAYGILAVWIVSGTCLYGATIGVDLGSADQSTALAASDVAGAPGFAAANWNVVTGYNETTSPSLPAALVDDGAAATGAELTLLTAQGTASGPYSPPATPDQKLFGSFIQSPYEGIHSDNNRVVFTVENIPYEEYDVVVYIQSDSAGRTGTVTLSNSTVDYYFSTPTDYNSYTQITSTSSDEDYMTGNYMVFEGLSGSSFTMSRPEVNNWSGVTGFQVVEVPEPGALALLVAGLFGVMQRGGWLHHEHR